MFKQSKKGASTIKTMIMVAVLCVVFVLSMSFGAAAFGFRMEGEPTAFGDDGIDSLPAGSKGCYLKDDAFEATTSPIQSSDQVLEKIGPENRKKLEKNKTQLDKLITKAQDVDNNINPALLIAIWGGESTFDNGGKALGCAVYSGVDPDFRAKATKNFDSQVDCAISQGIKKAIEKRAPYDAPQNQNTFTRLFFNYTGAMKSTYQKYGYVADANNSRIKILNSLVPDQVTCEASPLDGTKKFKDLEQVKASYGTTPEEIKKHLTTVSFMGQNITVNKVMVDDLKKVETGIKNSGYKITSVGAYNAGQAIINNDDRTSHAFGLAIDINSPDNPTDRPAGSKSGDASVCKPQIPTAVINAFKNNNFFWGAELKEICDPMHFQYGGNWM